MQEFRILDYDPLYSDIHCGIHIQLRVNIKKTKYNNESITSVNDSNLTGKWSIIMEGECKAEINENKIKELIEQMDSMTIEEVNFKLKSILLEPGLKVSSPKRTRNHVKQSSNASLFRYDSVGK